MTLSKYKDIVDLVKKGATVEAQERIMELREAINTLQEENFDLRNKIQELEEEIRIKGQLIFSKSVYWLHNDKEKDGPFALAAMILIRNCPVYAYSVPL